MNAQLQAIERLIDQSLTDVQAICNMNDDRTVEQMLHHLADELGKALSECRCLLGMSAIDGQCCSHQGASSFVLLQRTYQPSLN